MDLKNYMQSWTDEQWADAERTDKEVATMLGEDAYREGLVCLVIEERKRDPATTVEAVLFLVTVLGVETMFELRHEAKDRKAKTRRRGKLTGPGL